MRKILISTILSFFASFAHAGLITHTDYTSGGVITSAGQNANENTIYNEFNGNIESVNIKTAGIATSNIAAGAVTLPKLESGLQGFYAYRRPNLIWISTDTVDVENNTGTANETCIMFPDERRCMTEDTSSANQFRRFILSATASVTSTYDSGLKSGLTLATSSWYLIYAVKTTDNSSNFVLVGDTVTPVQANYASLNSRFNSNGWVYLGAIRVGDNDLKANQILKFKQSGGLTHFRNVKTATNPGFVLASHSSTSPDIIWAYTIGVSSVAVPGNFTYGIYVNTETGVCAPAKMQNSAQSINYAVIDTGASVWDLMLTLPINEGTAINCSGNTPETLNFSGFIDGALEGGPHPQL